jgi:hypothetical protein
MLTGYGNTTVAGNDSPVAATSKYGLQVYLIDSASGMVQHIVDIAGNKDVPEPLKHKDLQLLTRVQLQM